eukprot:6205720-Pleurochrysis_carterae.AAC.1
MYVKTSDRKPIQLPTTCVFGQGKQNSDVVNVQKHETKKDILRDLSQKNFKYILNGRICHISTVARRPCHDRIKRLRAATRKATVHGQHFLAPAPASAVANVVITFSALA